MLMFNDLYKGAFVTCTNGRMYILHEVAWPGQSWWGIDKDGEDKEIYLDMIDDIQ